ncbi:MAG: prolipoprotein diacylglyceryl transferase [Terrimicrobiaceae bacterium]
MFLAYYVHDLSPFVLDFGNGFGLRWYGLAYVAAFFAGGWLYLDLTKKGYSDLQPSQVGDFITGAALFGVILGGRLGYMLLYDWDRFIADPLVFFKFWDGGMSSHGGMAGIVVFTFIYARRKHVSWLNIGDNLVVVAPVGIFFGRCANFINGELFGRVTGVPWAVQFPKELYDAPPETVRLAISEAATLNPGWTTAAAVADNVRHSPALREQLAGTLSPRHPSQIYEALLEGAFLFALLYLLRTRLRLPNGVLTGIFFIAYAVLRIIGEVFRQPDAPLTMDLSRGQFLSLFLVVMGGAFLFYATRKPSWAPKFHT